MTGQRLDLYTQFHKGIRRALFDLAVVAGKTDFRDEVSVTDLDGRCRRILGLLREHGRVEDQHFHPAIEERAPGSTSQIHGEHDEEEEHCRGIEAQLDRIMAAAPHERTGLGLQLYRAINAFCSRYLVHLAEEELVLMPKFWEHFTDEELAALRGKVQASMSANRMLEWLAEVLPASAIDERTELLEGIRKNASEEIFERACDVARETLPPADWNNLAGWLGIAIPGTHG